jgi:tetratricopeptide (TPR) repeat protein
MAKTKLATAARAALLLLAGAGMAAQAGAEDITHCKTGQAMMAKDPAGARTELKLCLASGKLGPQSTALVHMNLALIAFATKKWQEVINEYDAADRIGKAAGKQPAPDALTQFHRGVAHAELGQLKQARIELDDAVKGAPTPAARLEVLPARMSVLSALGETDAALADGATLAASGQTGLAVMGHMRRSAIFVQLKRGDDALAEVNAARAADPKNMEVLVMRLNLENALGQKDKALEDASTLAGSPVARWSVLGHLARAGLYREQKRLDDALGELNAAHKADPKNLDVVADRMRLFQVMGQSDKALADSQTLIASSVPPAQWAGHIFRGALYDHDKKYAAALAEADAAIKVNPKNPIGHNNRCMAQANLGQGAAAVATCQKALALAPGEPMVLNSMGFALEKSGKTQEAEDYYQKAAAAEPNNPGYQADLKRVQAALAKP